MASLLVDSFEVAPDGCVVCGKEPPGLGDVGWSYLAGSYPIGSMTCSEECLAVALERFERTGRVDLKGT